MIGDLQGIVADISKGFQKGYKWRHYRFHPAELSTSLIDRVENKFSKNEVILLTANFNALSSPVICAPPHRFDTSRRLRLFLYHCILCLCLTKIKSVRGSSTPQKPSRNRNRTSQNPNRTRKGTASCRSQLVPKFSTLKACAEGKDKSSR